MLEVASRIEQINRYDPRARGYHVVYRPNEANHCPGCGGSHWMIGRLMAECAFCSTALPLLEAGMNGIGTFRRNVRVSETETLLAA